MNDIAKETYEEVKAMDLEKVLRYLVEHEGEGARYYFHSVDFDQVWLTREFEDVENGDNWYSTKLYDIEDIIVEVTLMKLTSILGSRREAFLELKKVYY